MGESYAKFANQARRLPVEIDAAKRRGDEDQAKRAQEHLNRAREALARRGGR